MTTAIRTRSGARRLDWLVSQLPVGMLEDDLLVRLTRAFQEVADTIMEGADNIDRIMDATVAPPPAVRFLGRWVSIDMLDPESPEGFQRRAVRLWGDVLAWRGTERGLGRFLELLTGGPVEIDDGGGIFRAGEAPVGPAVVRVRVPAGGPLSEGSLRALIADEVPAHLVHELEVVPTIEVQETDPDG